jgi:hypothetical protein
MLLDNVFPTVELPSRQLHRAFRHNVGQGRLRRSRLERWRPQQRAGALSSTTGLVTASATASSSRANVESRIDGSQDNDLIRRFQEEYGRTNAQLEGERKEWLEELERKQVPSSPEIALAMV